MILENSPVQPATMTKKEVARARKTATQLEKMRADGFKTKEVTIGPVTANVMGIIYALILFIPVFLIYYFKFGYIFEPVRNDIVGTIAFLAYLLFIPAHEAVHGICMWLFNGHQKEGIEFGINSGMPYCTCQAPIKKWAYIIVCAAPTVIFAPIFAVIAIHMGAFEWLLWTFFAIAGGGGDFTVIAKLLFRKEKELTVVDHPYKCGLLILHKDEAEDESEKIINELNTVEEKNPAKEDTSKAIKAFLIGCLIGLCLVGGFIGYKIATEDFPIEEDEIIVDEIPTEDAEINISTEVDATT